MAKMRSLLVQMSICEGEKVKTFTCDLAILPEDITILHLMKLDSKIQELIAKELRLGESTTECRPDPS